MKVNNTVSPGQGFSWARPCLLVSDGITVDDIEPAFALNFEDNHYVDVSIYTLYNYTYT